MIATVRIRGRMGDHAGAHRIEFYVTLAGQKVVVVLYQTGFVSALPERTGSIVFSVERLHITSANCLHNLWNRSLMAWCRQQVNVIGHEDIAMYGTAVLFHCMAERPLEMLVVIRFEERVLFVHTANDDVLWIIRQEISGLARHEGGRKLDRVQPIHAELPVRPEKVRFDPTFWGQLESV